MVRSQKWVSLGYYQCIGCHVFLFGRSRRGSIFLPFLVSESCLYSLSLDSRPSSKPAVVGKESFSYITLAVFCFCKSFKDIVVTLDSLG